MMRAIRRVALLSGILLAALAAAAGASALAATARHHRPHRRATHRHARHHLVRVHATRQTTRQAALAPLRFGIYPWASPGAVNPVAPPAPDDPNAALTAVKQLQGDRSFVVHLYGQYTGADSGEAAHLLSDARWWSQNGVQVEMVLRYRPASANDAGGYRSWVSSVSSQLASIPRVVAIQVGNEGNNAGSAAAADGAYPGATRAIAQGVVAARSAVVEAGRSDLRIGFNVAAGSNPCRVDPYFAALRRAGGPAFSSAVSWVGIDIYPGTWSGAASDHPASAAVESTMSNALRCLRTQGMSASRLSSGTSITVAETGYPTDANRSEATQTSVLRTVVAAVQRIAPTYNVTDLRWFSLRDGNTSSRQLENGYGLLRDDYTAKPAFTAFAQLIGRYGV